MLTYVPKHRETPPLKSSREWVGNNDRIAEKFGTEYKIMENGRFYKIIIIFQLF